MTDAKERHERHDPDATENFPFGVFDHDRGFGTLFLAIGFRDRIPVSAAWAELVEPPGGNTTIELELHDRAAVEVWSTGGAEDGWSRDCVRYDGADGTLFVVRESERDCDATSTEADCEPDVYCAAAPDSSCCR